MFFARTSCANMSHVFAQPCESSRAKSTQSLLKLVGNYPIVTRWNIRSYDNSKEIGPPGMRAAFKHTKRKNLERSLHYELNTLSKPRTDIMAFAGSMDERQRGPQLAVRVAVVVRPRTPRTAF